MIDAAETQTHRGRESERDRTSFFLSFFVYNSRAAATEVKEIFSLHIVHSIVDIFTELAVAVIHSIQSTDKTY